MRLVILAFGKLKAPGLRQAADYYLKLTKGFDDVEEIELKATPLADKSAASRAKALSQDAAVLRAAWEKRTAARRRIVLLDEKGPAKPTLAWARILEAARDQGIADLVFCVGSSMGFAEEIRKEAHECLSLGAQTLPHELARVVLFEQLFRCLSVLDGHPYHNEG